MTVFQLASIGDKDAAEIVEKLNLTFEETQNGATSKTSPELMALNNIMLETRYRTSVAIAEAEPAILSLIDEDKRSAVHFCGVDATNGESLKKALKDADGPLCITTEGLLMYFSDSEAGALCDNIRMLLKEHGGYRLTSDPEASLQYLLTLQPIAGERFKEILMQSLNRVQDKSDVSVGKNALNVSARGDTAQNMKNAMMFLASHGLKAERIIIADQMP